MEEEYKMGDAVLGRTTQEKDLGVTGLIRRTIMYKEKQLIVPLYNAIVRPRL